MKKSIFAEEQMTSALRQADSEMPVAEVCRQLEVPLTGNMATTLNWV